MPKSSTKRASVKSARKSSQPTHGKIYVELELPTTLANAMKNLASRTPGGMDAVLEKMLRDGIAADAAMT